VPHRLGVSTVSWGDFNNGWATHVKKRNRTPEMFGNEDVSLAYGKLMQRGGVGVWEVAAGGPGAALLGKCIEVNPQLAPPQIITRCAPSPRARLDRFLWSAHREAGSSVENAVRQTLEDLKLKYVDLVLTGPSRQKRGLGASLGVSFFSAGAVERQGRLVGEVGISNVAGAAALKAAYDAFERRGLRCVACEVDFSLVDAAPLIDGTLDVAKELDLTVFAKSPLARGLGSGKYTVGNPTGGGGYGAFPLWRYRCLEAYAPLHETLLNVARQVSARRTGKAREDAKKSRPPDRPLPPEEVPKAVTVTTTQVALHWLIAHGAVPLPAVKNPAHADEILGCRGWVLTKDERDQLDDVATYKMPLWPTRRRVGITRLF